MQPAMCRYLIESGLDVNGFGKVSAPSHDLDDWRYSVPSLLGNYVAITAPSDKMQHFAAGTSRWRLRGGEYRA